MPITHPNQLRPMWIEFIITHQIFDDRLQIALAVCIEQVVPFFPCFAGLVAQAQCGFVVHCNDTPYHSSLLHFILQPINVADD